MAHDKGPRALQRRDPCLPMRCKTGIRGKIVDSGEIGICGMAARRRSSGEAARACAAYNFRLYAAPAQGRAYPQADARFPASIMVCKGFQQHIANDGKMMDVLMSVNEGRRRFHASLEKRKLPVQGPPQAYAAEHAGP